MAAARQGSKKNAASSTTERDNAQPASLTMNAAARAFRLGQWRTALSLDAALVKADPTLITARLRLADALLNLGHHAEASRVYRAVGEHAFAAGHPLIGLVAIKLVELTEGDTDDLLTDLEDGYAQDAARLDALYAGTSLPQPADGLLVTPLAVDDALVHTATTIGATAPRDLAAVVPAIPFLSYLDGDGLQTIVDHLSLRRCAAGDVILRQGDRSTSFFIVASGEVAIERDEGNLEGTTLATLRRGAVFGEQSLISDGPRQASAIAQADVDILELRAADLIVAAARVPSVHEALRAFTRERFLRHLTATHAFFAPLDRDDRHRVMERTVISTFEPGEALIAEGQKGPGLFVLLAGAAEVRKAQTRDNGAAGFIHLATLKAGDLCGEMSMLTMAPTTATVTAIQPVEALFLSREAFADVTAAHPSLLPYLQTLTEERVRHNRTVLGGPGRYDDEQILI